MNCLAAAKVTPIVASAGLRAEVFIWDMQKAMRINEQVALLTAVWLLSNTITNSIRLHTEAADTYMHVHMYVCVFVYAY